MNNNNAFENDFAPECRTPDGFLNFRNGSALANLEFDPISGYTDEDLRLLVVQELLSVTMWEVRTGNTLSFLCESLMRFIPRSDRQRVRILDALAHNEVQRFVVFEGDQIRLKKDRQSLQAAMDYCEVYYAGFAMPEGCIVVNRQAFEDILEENGGFNNYVDALAMDVMANVPGPRTKQ